MVRRAWLRQWGWIGLAAAWAGAARGSAQEEPTPTLHVYTDTIQIPVLVLGAQRQSLPPITGERFSVSLDSGPWFRAAHVRREGSDPISLGILLDTNGAEAALMPKMATALGDLVPGSLGVEDRVSIYAMGCSLVRTEYNMPVDAETMRDGVHRALAPLWAAKKQKEAGGCERSTKLWDSVAFVASQMRSMPGPRVLLVVTDGIDGGSLHLWNQVRVYLQSAGVAVFGLNGRSGFGTIDSIPIFEAEDQFRLLCEASGGMVTALAGRKLADTLKRVVAVVRERYIVEFPRPYDNTTGEHSLVVKIDGGPKYVVRPTGISVPVEDAATRDSPLTVPEDPATKPVLGKRRILPP